MRLTKEYRYQKWKFSLYLTCLIEILNRKAWTRIYCGLTAKNLNSSKRWYRRCIFLNCAGLGKLEFDLAEIKQKFVCHLHINDSEQNDVEESFGDQLNKLKIHIFIHISANMTPFGLKFSQMILHTETRKLMYNWSFLFVVLHKPKLLPSTFNWVSAGQHGSIIHCQFVMYIGSTIHPHRLTSSKISWLRKLHY